MPRYFYTKASCAGTSKFPAGILKHTNYVARVADEALAAEVAQDPRFVEITEEGYNELFFHGGSFYAPRHALNKPESATPAEPIPDSPVIDYGPARLNKRKRNK